MAELSKESGFATLTLPDGRSKKLKVLSSPSYADESVFVDIGDLYSSLGVLTYDPGFSCTASCSSAITYIDGNAGVCLYRGIPIEQLCEKSTFLEVAFLLFTGELPEKGEYREFIQELKKELMVHEKIKGMFTSFRMNAHPMAVMVKKYKEMT